MLGDEQLERLNTRIAQGQVKYVDSGSVDKPLQEGLVTEDDLTIYRIDDGIPVMLIDKGISVSQLQD